MSRTNICYDVYVIYIKYPAILEIYHILMCIEPLPQVGGEGRGVYCCAMSISNKNSFLREINTVLIDPLLEKASWMPIKTKTPSFKY